MKSLEVATMLKQFIDEHFAEIRSLKESKLKVARSYKYVAHCFRREFGMSPERYLGSVRMQKAKDLLRGTALQIIDIIREVGVRDDIWFRKKFRQEQGYTMSDYRHDQRAKESHVQIEQSILRRS